MQTDAIHPNQKCESYLHFFENICTIDGQPGELGCLNFREEPNEEKKIGGDKKMKEVELNETGII